MIHTCKEELVIHLKTPIWCFVLFCFIKTISCIANQHLGFLPMRRRKVLNPESSLTGGSNGQGAVGGKVAIENKNIPINAGEGEVSSAIFSICTIKQKFKQIKPKNIITWYGFIRLKIYSFICNCWISGFSFRFQSSCCCFFCDAQGSLVPLLNQLLNPNLQVLRIMVGPQWQFYMGTRCFETPGWLVGRLVWLFGCVSLQDANLTIQVILQMFLSDETRIKRFFHNFLASILEMVTIACACPYLLIILFMPEFLHKLQCPETHRNPAKTRGQTTQIPSKTPIKPIETHQVFFPISSFPANNIWQDPMLFERLLSKIFLVDVSGCNTYIQTMRWFVLHTNKKSHSFLWTLPVDYCKTIEI